MLDRDLSFLSIPLPEDILREKLGGRLNNALKMIDVRLNDASFSYPMLLRLAYEKNTILAMKERYVRTPEEALEEIRETCPAMTGEELEELRLKGKLDFAYIDGELRYPPEAGREFLSACPEYRKQEAEEERLRLERSPRRAEDHRVLRAGVTVREEAQVSESLLEEGDRILVSLPVPEQGRDGIQVKALRMEPELPADCMEEREGWLTFRDTYVSGRTYALEYDIEREAAVCDLSETEARGDSRTGNPDEFRALLREELPHIAFTPFLKDLAENIAKGEEDPAGLARKIYDFVTTGTICPEGRGLLGVPCASEYLAAGRRGNMSFQAILFVTLCRISGIPARLKSGLRACEEGIEARDYAEFYLPGEGWLPCDPGLGNAGLKRGSIVSWNYYFGNVDPAQFPVRTRARAIVLAKEEPEEQEAGGAPEEEQTGIGDRAIIPAREEQAGKESRANQEDPRGRAKEIPGEYLHFRCTLKAFTDLPGESREPEEVVDSKYQF